MRIAIVDIANWMPFAERHELVIPAGAVAVVGSYTGDVSRSNWVSPVQAVALTIGLLAIDDRQGSL